MASWLDRGRHGSSEATNYNFRRQSWPTPSRDFIALARGQKCSEAEWNVGCLIIWDEWFAKFVEFPFDVGRALILMTHYLLWGSLAANFVFAARIRYWPVAVRESIWPRRFGWSVGCCFPVVWCNWMCWPKLWPTSFLHYCCPTELTYLDIDSWANGCSEALRFGVLQFKNKI